MTPDPHLRAGEIFDRAVEMDPAEWSAFVSRECAEDEEVGDLVRRLLRGHERVGLLDRDPHELVSGGREPPAEAERHIGSYRLIRELGRGGMGVVHLGERDDGQFRRRVAVKVLRSEIAGEELTTRFTSERQILASLDHPNIALLLDGGVTERGTPFLVMEYVEGLPITAYCDRRGLDVEERLRLFRSVCAAVNHAHQNLVIHRDIKPGNILVTNDGRVKLLDFGIAKLLNPGLTLPDQPITRTAFRLLTPEYASPEQVRGEPLSTASDVYALGVVLYQLLAGHSPYPETKGAPHELAELICEHDPAPPSVRLARRTGSRERSERAAGGDTATPEELARARGDSVRRLRQRLRGDLDAIALKALRKEPNRRYGSARELDDDLRRYLEGMPVKARRDSPLYRTRKFVRRHRWGALVMAAVAGLLLTYTVTTTIQNRRVTRALALARVEADRASQLSDLLLGLFVSTAGETDSAAVRLLLDRGLSRANQIRERPADRAQMLAMLGEINYELGEYESATSLLDEALVEATAAFGEGHLTVAETRVRLADVHRAMNRLPEAEGLLREALAAESALLGADHPRTARTMARLALVVRDQGDLEGARTLGEQALDIRRRLLGPEHPDVATSTYQLADLVRRTGDYGRAGRLYRDALELRRRLFAGDRLEVAESMAGYGLYLEIIGDYREAERYYRESLDMYRHLVGPEHPSLTPLLSSLGLVVGRQGRSAEADELLQSGVALSRTLYGEGHPEVARALRLVGLQHLRSRNPAAAEAPYRQSLELLRAALGDDHLEVALSRHGLGAALLGSGRPLEAAEHLREALRIREAGLEAGHPFVANTLHELGSAALELGALDEAETHLLRALEIRLANRDVADAASTAERLAELNEKLGRSDEVERYRRMASGEGGTTG